MKPPIDENSAVLQQWVPADLKDSLQQAVVLSTPWARPGKKDVILKHQAVFVDYRAASASRSSKSSRSSSNGTSIAPNALARSSACFSHSGGEALTSVFTVKLPVNCKKYCARFRSNISKIIKY